MFGKEDVIVKFLLPTSIPLTYTLSVLTWIVLLPVMYTSLYPVRDTTSIYGVSRVKLWVNWYFPDPNKTAYLFDPVGEVVFAIL